jgi:hypothetical protein
MGYWLAGILTIVVAGVAFVLGWEPAGGILAAASAAGPLFKARRGAKGTALGPALIWGALAIGLATLSQMVGLIEPLETGRPWMGRLMYVAVLSSLAALISILNARTPGEGAWAILMGLLVLVFLIPWLEEPGRFFRAGGLAHIRLDAPWTIFFGLLAVMGVSNYLPTRYGLASAWLGIGYGLEYLTLTQPGWDAAMRARAWSAIAWCWGAAAWTAYGCALRPNPGRNSLEQTWFWFRDHWGVVWALRVSERFNKTAEPMGWPIRLAWFGVVGDENKPVGEETERLAVRTFHSLLRRFATAERLESQKTESKAAPEGSSSDACESGPIA